MFKVLNKIALSTDLKRIDVFAPVIAKKAKPGQFVSVSPEEDDERIPLTIIEADAARGTITLIIHERGITTKKLGAIAINDLIFSILGPLGVPATIEKVGVVVCIATGVGIPQILPICRALKKAGNNVIGIIGAKTKRALMVEPQMRLVCNKLFTTTNDGSYERRGEATDVFQGLVDKQDINLVYAIGNHEMMQKVCETTRVKNIRTRVHLNPMMVDCMGMCGSCRVTVGGKQVLACIDGPEFDGHAVDFKDFSIRMKSFNEELWRNFPLKSNPAKSETGTFKRFLSGILNK
jgi:ferredoxin--NADP+ reductase